MNSPIENFIDALERAGTSVKRSGDKWTCRCPGHEDRLASMSISVGSDERVLVHCFAGCTPEHIVKCLGRSMRDLMPPRTPAPQNSTKKRASKKRGIGPSVPNVDLNARHQAFLSAITEERVADLARELAVTSEALGDLEIGWCDSAGLKVLRAGGAGWENDAYPAGAFSFPERDGTGQIVGFTLRAVDGRKGCPSGKVGSRRGLIIPKSLLSSNPGDAIILNVEGASDVAAAMTMGLHAIGRPSNGGGLDDLVKFLKGRRVLTLGENDQKEDGKWPGRDGAVTIAKGLEKALGRGLGRWCLPPSDAKDVRSWLQARMVAGLDLRNEAARIGAGSAFVQALVTAEPESASQDEDDEGDDEPLARYEATPNGFIWHKRTADDIVPVLVSTWTANIVSDITEDDGVESRKLFELAARVRDREPITFMLTAEEFNLMNWPIRYLGSGAITFPGTNNPAHARTAIQLLSPDAERRDVFGHTGWRKVQGQWLYLHASGGIGADGLAKNVQVSLPGSLKGYELPPPPDAAALTKAIRGALRSLHLGPSRVVYALFASPFTAIIGGVDFSQFLVGPTGVFKSETASLFQRFFGTGFTARQLPASWTSTDNALEDIAFRAKDTLLVIDDFKPSGGAGDDKLHQKADRVLRAQGNGNGRLRMRSDCSLRPERPPRGMIISTGEDVPRGQSLKGRSLIHELSKGEIDVTVLTECQSLADAGVFALVTAAFCQWLAPQLDQVRSAKRDRLEVLRREYGGAIGSSHARLPGMLASLHHGFEVFVRFVREVSGDVILTDNAALDKLDKFAAGMREAGAAQQIHQQTSEPAQQFLQLLSSAIVAGKAHVCGMNGAYPERAGAWGWRDDSESGSHPWKAMGDRIGWVEGPNLYLDPNAAFRVAQAQVADGQRIAVGETTLRKRLFEKNYLVSTEKESQGTYTVRVTVQSARHRVLHLRASDVVNTSASTEDGENS